jgi:hypothetical protein
MTILPTRLDNQRCGEFCLGGPSMLNYQVASVINGQSAVHTVAQREEIKGEIPFVTFESLLSIATRPVSETNKPSLEITIEETDCCPMADAVNRLHQILKPLSIRKKRPLQSHHLMLALDELVKEIDRTYEHVEQRLRTEMASLQLQVIKESSARQMLVAKLEHLIESTNVAELEGLDDPVRQLLEDSNDFEAVSHPERVAVLHPEIADATRCLAIHQQPASLRFRQLQQEIYHAAKHRVTQRREIAETLSRCGLNGMSRKMQREAAMMEMGSYKRSS